MILFLDKNLKKKLRSMTMQAVLSRKIMGVLCHDNACILKSSSFCELATQTVLFTKIKIVLFVGFFHNFFLK